MKQNSIKFALFALITGLFLTFNQSTNAQSVLDGFDPNANGEVRAIVVQPDGKILIGGGFTTVQGVTRNRIARLNVDGTLDTAFDPNIDSIVFTIALQADGKILVGGGFNTVGGLTRNRIARLDPTTGAPDSFDPNSNNPIYSIVVQTDGKILVGGAFFGANSIGGQTRNRIARLDPTTGLADWFDPNANATVQTIAVQPNGKILVGGDFNGANSIGGQTRNRIARLDITSGAADSFDPNASGSVFTIAVQPDGKILAGGAFNGANSIGGQTRNRVARLDQTTGLADSFNPNASAIVYKIALQTDGRILVGGNFTFIGGATRNRIARLDQATGLADSFNPSADNAVLAIAVQPDSKILVGGFFSSSSGTGGIGGQTRNYIARLERDGRIDRTLDVSTVGTYVTATAIQPDGKILIGGIFTTVLGVARNNIARLNVDGTLDTGFNPSANGTVNSIAVQSDGKVLAGGQFTGIGGQTRNRIARLDGTTGLADSFDPNPNNIVLSIAVQSDGKVLVGGAFTGIGGQTRNRIARLDGTTGLADSFDPNANSDVYSIAVQSDGKILAGGNYSTIGGQPRNRIARLDGGSGLADSWNPSADGIVFSITVQPDGKVLVGGIFTNIGGQARNLFARFSNDTPVLQNLNVVSTAIGWTRNGAGAQFTRVTFEQSTDNGANYTFLGTATNNFAESAGKDKNDNQLAPQASGYVLNGLNIPTGQNVLIRARGYYRTGYFGGSETTEELVRNVFLLSPTAANVSVGGRILAADGAGVRNAIVQLTKANGETLTTHSSSFGNYRFEGIEGGQTVVVSVISKRYTFASQVVTLNESVSELDFIEE